jgi:TDG/mug DNA glycosylase family protein
MHMSILPDVLESGLKIVFCGTAAGNKSAELKQYYAHPQNRFWRTLKEVGLTPTICSSKDFVTITKYGLGLTDLAQNVFGPDSRLKDSDYDVDSLREKIVHHQPLFLAFTSKTAAQYYLGRPCEYGLQPEVIGTTRLYVLCSPSTQATRYWNKDIWQELANRATKN